MKADVCVLYVQEHKCRMQRAEKGVYCVYHYIDLNGAETGEGGWSQNSSLYGPLRSGWDDPGGKKLVRKLLKVVMAGR